MPNQLMRWDPFDDFRQMRRMMERFIGPSFGLQDLDVTTQGEALPLDVYEKGDQLVVKAALPGVDPNDIEVNVRDGVLHINAESRQEQDVREGDYLRHEYRYGRTSRSIQLPPDVDFDKAEANYEHGMLRLCFPKTQADRARSMRIEVKGAQAGGGQRRLEAGQQQQQQQGQAQAQQGQQQGRGRSTQKT